MFYERFCEVVSNFVLFTLTVVFVYSKLVSLHQVLIIFLCALRVYLRVRVRYKRQAKRSFSQQG